MTEHPHIVAIGGGGGATQVLRAAAPFAARSTAIIAVTDTGRSTGLARQIGGIPAPGDLRATIAAFAADAQVGALLQHRLSGAGVPQLEGMAFGNLLLAALAEVTGDFAAAVAQVAQMAQTTVAVLPVSAANTQICAELTDGRLVAGELNVRGLGKPAIKRLFLDKNQATGDRRQATGDRRQATGDSETTRIGVTQNAKLKTQNVVPPAAPAALAAIRAADLVVLGPGSLWTTLLACLLFEGVAEALRETRGTVAYVCNTTTQPGQTDGYTALDHVRRIVDAVGPGVLDAALINRSAPAAAALRQYEAEGLFLLQPDEDEIAAIAALGVAPHVAALTEAVGEKRALWNKQDTVRHDVGALGAALRALLPR